MSALNLSYTHFVVSLWARVRSPLGNLSKSEPRVTGYSCEQFSNYISLSPFSPETMSLGSIWLLWHSVSSCPLSLPSTWWCHQVTCSLQSLTMFFSCQLVRNPDTGFHKHYGFVEYKEPKSMKEAIQAMNGFDLGGQLIRVGPCVGKFENITF